MNDYAEFLAARAQLADSGGFEPDNLPPHLFDYQTAIVEWAVRKGRAGMFADCGLGKTGDATVTAIAGGARAMWQHKDIGTAVLRGGSDA